MPTCKKNGIEYSEVQVANDGIAVVSNPSLKIACLTTDQLKQLWKKGSSVTNYDQLGSGIPSGKVSLYGPGTDSGTFDFFTEEINGEKGDTRTDYQPSEDDNVLVQGVAGDKTAIGYFGFSYYEDNQDKLNLIAVDSGDGCIKPSKETIQDGSYKPLSRPLFMYPNTKVVRLQAAGQGLHGLHGRQRRRDRGHGEHRPDDRRAAHQGQGRGARRLARAESETPWKQLP